MKQYLDLLRHVRHRGTRKSDRTGTGTLSVFGHQMRFDLGRDFPVLTTKRLHLKSIIYELLWFLRGESNVGYLRDHGVTIWDEWADEDGELGPVYGVQWRSWPAADGTTIDQVAGVIEQIKANPDSRRLISAPGTPGTSTRWPWRPAMPSSVYVLTAPCPVLYQRSADIFLGVPFCLLFPAHPDDGPGHRPCPGEFVHTLGEPPVPEPPGAGGRAVDPGTPAAAADAAQPRRQ